MKKDKTLPQSKIKSIKQSLTPKGRARYNKLINAAAEVFLKYGFEKARMSEIVKRAGGSFVTIYKVFGSKEAIFIETLSQKTEELFADIESSALAYEGNFEAFLYNFGVKFITLTINDDTCTFHRLIVQEGHKNDAKVGKLFFENAMKRTSTILAEYFRKEKARGNIDVEDPELAAYQFLQVVKEPHFFGKVLGLDVDKNQLFDIDKSLRQTIKIFSQGMLIKK